MAPPSSFTNEIADTICRRLSEGESLRSICATEGMPDRETVRRWRAADDGFDRQIMQARVAQAENMADELIDIADDGTNDYVERVRDDGVTHVVFDGEHYQRSRLRVDVRKWYLSKVLPKIYGDKLGVELSGDEALLAAMEQARERVRQGKAVAAEVES